MAFSGGLQITAQDFRTVQPITQLSGIVESRFDTQLGAVGTTTDGRQWQWGVNNATTAAIAGNLQTGQAQIANHATRTIVTPQAAGTSVLVVTVGATAVTQDQYASGFLSIVSGTTPIIALRIRGNSAAVSSGITTITLDEPLPLGITGSTVVSLIAAPTNLFAITSATIANNNYVGVPNVAVPASNGAWLQVGGFAQVLSDGTTFTKNAGIIGSATTAGAVGVETATALTQRLGYNVEATATSSTGLVNLQIL